MTAQHAAHKILIESRKPLSATEIARVALDRKLVVSVAKTPVASIAQTLEKNVRERSRNNPALRFVYEANRRLLALPEWEGNAELGQVVAESSSGIELKACIHRDLLEQVQLAVQSRIAAGYNDTVALLLRRGLATEAAHIREGLLKQLKQLDAGNLHTG